jgi:hypothetical protein
LSKSGRIYPCFYYNAWYLVDAKGLGWGFRIPFPYQVWDKLSTGWMREAMNCISGMIKEARLI